MISVVIPTYNRCRDLDRCLEALYHQTLDQEHYEVVVIDDGSQDETPQALESWSARWPRLRFVCQQNGGPASARNNGVMNARGSIISFTDDDTVPAPDWLEWVFKKFRDGLTGCLHGRVRSSLPSGTFVHSVVADGSVITSNLAIEKSILIRLGMFDTAFRAPWCEDADLYYRLRKAEVKITYDPDLIVDHPPRYQSYCSFWRKCRFFQYHGLIAKKHPDTEWFGMHRQRLITATKKILGIIIFIVLWHRVLSQPPWLGLLIALSLFWAVDAQRLYGLKGQLEQRGIHIRWSDQILFVCLNWLTNPIEVYYLLKGWLLYRAPIRWSVSKTPRVE